MLTPNKVFLLLVRILFPLTTSPVLSQDCSTDHGDCSCADRTFSGCSELFTEDKQQVAGIEECIEMKCKSALL